MGGNVPNSSGSAARILLGLLLGVAIFMAAAAIAIVVITIIKVLSGHYAMLLVLLGAAMCGYASYRTRISYRQVRSHIKGGGAST